MRDLSPMQITISKEQFDPSSIVEGGKKTPHLSPSCDPDNYQTTLSLKPLSEY